MNTVAGTARAERHLALLIHLGGNAGEHGDLGAQEVEIVAGQADLRAGFGASGLQGSAPGKDGDQVASKSAEGDHQSVLKAGAVSQQQNHRGNAPGHAQHGEQRAAAVVFQRVESLCAQIAQHSYSELTSLEIVYSCRSASTGGSSAALRAG